jgi:hypothetical protein
VSVASLDVLNEVPSMNTSGLMNSSARIASAP